MLRKGAERGREKRKGKGGLTCGKVLDVVFGDLGSDPPQEIVLGRAAVLTLGDVISQDQGPDQTEDKLEVAVDFINLKK